MNKIQQYSYILTRNYTKIKQNNPIQKNFRNKLSKGIKDLCTENYKIFLKKWKKIQINGIIIHVCGIEEYC
jgi:hypothetical protein